MKLWILQKRDDLKDHDPWDPWWDKTHGLVVRAATEAYARELAAEEACDEGGYAWRESKYSTCDELVADGPEGIVIAEHQAG